MQHSLFEIHKKYTYHGSEVLFYGSQQQEVIVLDGATYSISLAVRGVVQRDLST